MLARAVESNLDKFKKANQDLYVSTSDIITEVQKKLACGLPAQSAIAPLSGINNDDANRIRNKLYSSNDISLRDKVCNYVGINNTSSWSDRHKLIGWNNETGKLSNNINPYNYTACLNSLVGINNDHSFTIRNALIKNNCSMRDVAKSLTGLDDIKSWNIRNTYLTNIGADVLLESLRGLSDNKSWNIRAKSLSTIRRKDNNNASLNNALLISRSGLSSKTSWLARKEIIREGS